MDSTQTKIIELLREVHPIAFKEMERLTLRIAELESRDRPPIEKPSRQPSLPSVAPSATFRVLCKAAKKDAAQMRRNRAVFALFRTTTRRSGERKTAAL
jgi:hypothetical protein